MPTLPLFRDSKGDVKGSRVFKRLRLPDVRGQPTFGQVGRPWLLEIVEAIFGSLDPATFCRMVQEFFVLVPKKNGKSTGAAGIMLTAAIVTTRPGDEGTYLAPTKEIADIAFGQTEGMIKADPALAATFHVQGSIRTITNRNNGCTIKIKAADTDAITGIKGSFALVDETHEFARKPRAAHVFLELRGALAARPDGFLLQISTQSKIPPTGVFLSELSRARDVRDGKLDIPLLPVLYELPEHLKGNWRDESLWGLINPNLDGGSLDREFLRTQLLAKRENTADLALFASQHFNVQIGTTLRDDGWAGAKYWDRGTEPGLTLDELLDRCEVATVGLDGGGLEDLLGVAVIGRERETRRWLGWAHALISPEGIEQRKANEGQYKTFIEDGDLTVVRELPDDLDGIVAIVSRVKAAGKLAKVACDPMGVGLIVDALAEIGVTQEAGLLGGVKQGIGLMSAAETIERKLVDRTFRHDGSRMMAWCAGNARLIATPTAKRIVRDESGYGKIDPLMALFNAADAMGRNPSVDKDPEYQMFFLGKSSKAA